MTMNAKIVAFDLVVEEEEKGKEDGWGGGEGGL